MSAADVDKALVLEPDEAVRRLLSLKEGQWYERKSGRIHPRDLSVPLVAFANAEGGTIAVGLHDGRVDGVSPDRINAIRQAAIDFTAPAVRCQVSELELEDGSVVMIIKVGPGDRVHETFKHECYLRVGDESRHLSFAQRQELEFDRGPSPFDGTPSRHVSPSDLDPRQVASYQQLLGSTTPEGMLRARNLLTRDGDVTVAGYLLLSEHPQDLFPNAYVRVLRYTDVVRGTGASLSLADDGDIRCEGSIPEQIMSAARAVDRLIPRRRSLAPSGLFEGQPILPREAWLEGIVNAVVHRSYSLSGDHIRVEIFPDRIEITSPGRFPGFADPEKPLTISRHARNPRIARVCSDLGVTQELGEGIRRIFEEMRRRGLSDPLYTQSAATVRLTLSASDALPAEVKRSLPRGALSILDVLRVANRPLGTGQIAELAGVTRPTAGRHLTLLRDADLVVWEGASQRDPRATWRLA